MFMPLRSLSAPIRVMMLLFTMLVLTGCSTLGNNAQPEEPKPDLSQLAHQAAQQMVANNPDLTRYSPMIAATFVSIDNLSQSSTFGRISS